MIDQAELRDPARKLLERIASAGADESWHAMVDAGWPALTAPESLDGLEQSLASACTLYMELGRALSPAPLLPSLLAIDTLLACAVSEQRDDWIRRIAGGEQIAVSLRDPRGAESRATLVRAVLGADRATHALIVQHQEPLVAIVPISAAGVDVVATPTWDATRNLSDLRIPDIGSSCILAQGAAAEAPVAAMSAHLHFAIAADCVGAGQAVLEQTVAHLKTRRQFDRPLALFQALKHRCADLQVSLQAAEAVLADYLQRAGDGQGTGATARARGAKAIASATFRTVAEEAMQLQGGMGMTAEHPCHLFLKRALLNEQLGSPNDLCDVAVGADVFRALQA